MSLRVQVPLTRCNIYAKRHIAHSTRSMRVAQITTLHVVSDCLADRLECLSMFTFLSIFAFDIINDQFCHHRHPPTQIAREKMFNCTHLMQNALCESLIENSYVSSVVCRRRSSGTQHQHRIKRLTLSVCQLFVKFSVFIFNSNGILSIVFLANFTRCPFGLYIQNCSEKFEFSKYLFFFTDIRAKYYVICVYGSQNDYIIEWTTQGKKMQFK